MSLSLQPAVPSSPLNGLPAQPVDGTAPQPLSFGEVLKVEEKKLQQEINAQSAAALLATIQQPALLETIHGFDAGDHAQSAQSVDQTALTVDSVQPAATQPRQNALLPQQVAPPEKAGFSVPTTKVEQTVEANPNPSLKLQTEPQPKEIETVVKRPMAIDESQEQAATTFAANTKAVPVSTPAIDAENLKEKTGVKIPVRKDESISTATSKPVSFKVSKAHPSETVYVVENTEAPNLSQPSRFTVADARISTPATMQVPSEASEAAPVENKSRNIFAAEIKPAETIQTKAPDFSVPQPVEKAEDPAAKISVEHLPFVNVGNAETDQKILVEQKQTMPAQADIESDSGSAVTLNNGASASKKEVSLPQQRPFVADSKSTLSEDMNISAEKPATTVRVITSENETSQPVAGIVTPNLKSPAPEIDNEPIATKTKMAAPVEVDIPSSEISQPAKDVTVPTVKVTAPEISDQPIAVEKKMAAPVQVEDVPASEISQPAKETVVPTAKVAAPEISDEPIAIEKKMVARVQVEDVPASEMSQPEKETVVSTLKAAAPETNEEPIKAEKKMTASVQVENVSASEMSQPAKETVVSTFKVTAPETGDEPIAIEKKMAVPVQMEDVSTSEMPQPAKETVAPTVKVTAPETGDKPIATEKKMAAPVQVEDVQISQPVKEIVAPTVKVAVPETGDDPIKAETKMAAPVQVKDVSTSEMSQPVKETVVPTVKVAAPEISHEPIKAETKMAAPVRVEDISANEMSQPAKETVEPTVKVTAPVQAEDVPASKVSHPVKETVVSTVKVTALVQAEVVFASEMSQPVKEIVASPMKLAAHETGDEMIAIEKKMAAPVQVEDVPSSKVAHPVKETVVSTVKVTAPVQAEVVSTSEISQPVKETVVPTVKVAVPETGEEPIKVEKKTAAPVQVEDVPASKVSQPVKETVVPTVKVVAPEMSDEPIKVDKKMAAPVQVEDVPASEMSQSAKETVVPTVKVAVPETGDEPIAMEKKMAAPVQVEDVSVSEMSQPAKEAMLKSKDDKAAPALEFDNATAESRLGVGGRPQIKNEAISFEQGNAPVEIQPKKVEQSASVEIKSEEKVTAKEPALDLESNVVIAGNEKGIADVVRKSPAVQVDPMAREVIEQITSQMKARIKSGETSISMKLNPEKLGGIEVQMTHNAQGISVSFITEQASTGQLIESQVNQLRQSLKDAGVQLANLSISQHGQSNQEGGGFRQSQHFAQTSQRDVPQVEDEGIQPQRVGLTSEIDYLV